jgi:hypothetical protein
VVAVKIPRFSISKLMGFVALAALYFWLWRSLGIASQLSELVLFAQFPMASVLILGLLTLLTGPRRSGDHPRLIGFEVFGLTALLILSAACALATEEIHEGIGSWLRSLGIQNPVFMVAVVTVFLLPQLAAGWLGAWLVGTYKIRLKVVIERRAREDPGLDLPGG